MSLELNKQSKGVVIPSFMLLKRIHKLLIKPNYSAYQICVYVRARAHFLCPGLGEKNFELSRWVGSVVTLIHKIPLKRHQNVTILVGKSNSRYIPGKACSKQMKCLVIWGRERRPWQTMWLGNMQKEWDPSTGGYKGSFEAEQDQDQITYWRDQKNWPHGNLYNVQMKLSIFRFEKESVCG